MTTAHNEDFAFYQIGFRCCSDPQAPSASPAAPKPATTPAAPSSRSGVDTVGGSGGAVNPGVSSSPAASGRELAGS